MPRVTDVPPQTDDFYMKAQAGPFDCPGCLRPSSVTRLVFRGRCGGCDADAAVHDDVNPGGARP